MNNKQKTMLLDVTFAAMESVRLDQRPGSRRETGVVRGMGRVGGLMDQYRLTPWRDDDMQRADALVDEFNAMITDDLGASASNEMLLHLGLASFEHVRNHERGSEKRRLDAGLDMIMGVIGVYDIERLPPAQVLRACVTMPTHWQPLPEPPQHPESV